MILGSFRRFMFLMFFIMLFLLNFVYSSSHDDCCYGEGNDKIVLCGDGGIEVGKADGPQLCARYNNDTYRRSCKPDGGECRNTVDGSRYIFEIDGTVFPSDYEDYCERLLPYNENCDNPPDPSGTSTPTTPDGGVTIGGDLSSDGGNTPDPNPAESPPSEEEIEVALRECAPENSFIMSIFATNSSCETGKPFCIYNPYLGGFFRDGYSSDSNILESLGITFAENSCIPKFLINSCDDYKTEENCNNDRANKNLSCEWVESSSFSDSYFSDVSGICVVKEVLNSETIRMNKKHYENRLNLIKDPSFEVGGSDSLGWNYNEDNREEILDAHHGFFVYNLLSGSSLFHDFYFPKKRGIYNPYFYARTGDSANLILEVKQFDDKQEEIGSSISYDKNLVSSDFFQRVDFGNDIRIDRSAYKVEFKLTSEGGDIEIDSVSFEASHSDSGSPDSNPEVFKPVQIYPKEASFCNLCYSTNNLNLCTEDKSKLLGNCSYMVSNLDESYNSSLTQYLGKYDNVHMKDRPWQSQSISNSELFCEMYLTEGSCEDEDNYINSFYSVLHNLTSRLCKWDDTYGCFKDSNNDGIADVIRTNPTSDRRTHSYDSNSWGEHYEKQNRDGIPSDFAFSCDTIPPNSYVYFTAKNNISGENVTITKGNNGSMIGDVKIYLEFSDFLPPSCNPYKNISRHDNSNATYLDFDIKSSAYSNQTTVPISLNQVGGEGSSLSIVDLRLFGQIPSGNYDISVRILDRSGNIGKSWDFSGINMDLYGPNITLIEPPPPALRHAILMTSSSNDLKFRVTDESSVTNCSYSIIMPSGGELNSDYVPNSTGHTVPDSNGIFYFNDTIINSTPEGSDIYNITVSCIDVFGQKGEVSYYIFADFHTAFVLIEPLDFKTIIDDFGYLNEIKFFHGVSSDNFSQRFNCSLNFSNLSTNETLNVSHIGDGFTTPKLNGSFYKNITGWIGFNNSGRHEGYVECGDQYNKIIQNLVYYYDTVPPEFIEFELVDVSSGSEKFVHYSQEDGRFYTRLNENLEFNVNLTLNGTVTWISEFLNITFENRSLYFTPEIIHSESIDNITDIEVRNVTIIDENGESINDSLSLSPSTVGWIYFSYTPSQRQHILLPLSGEDEGLNLFNYTVEFKDKAGNIGSHLIEIYQDNSTLDIELGGEVRESLISDSNKVYTTKEQPNIRVKLNSHSYRSFSCEVSLRQREGLKANYDTRNFSSVNSSIDFGIGDFHSSINLSTDGEFELDLDCVDIYNVSFSKSYVLVYDNVPPILNGIELIGGPIKAFGHRTGDYPFRDLNDSVRFNLSNVENEEAYNCILDIAPDSLGSNYYSCESTNVILYSPDSDSDSDPFVLLGGREKNSADDSVCTRRVNFDSLLGGSRGEDVMTNFTITAQCEDSAGLVSSPQNYTFSVGYYNEGFIRSDVSYSGGKPHLSAYSVFPFSNVKVITESNIRGIGNSSGILVDDLPQQGPPEGGVYTYEGDLDVGSYPDGTYNIRFDGYYNAASPFGETRNKLRVDTTPPNVSVSIPDEEGGEVFTSKFRINLNGSDSPLYGKLKVIKLYLGGTLIYEENNEGNVIFMNNTFLIGPNASHFISEVRYLNKDLTFIAGEFNNTYSFKVELYDYVGNVGSDSITVTTNPMINYDMVNTPDQSYVLGPLHLITNLNAPVISFRISTEDLTCRVYPLIDQKWGSLIRNETKYYEAVRDSSEADKYSIDLSSVPSFSFDDNILEDENGGKSVNVKLSCQNEGIWVNQTIDLRWVDTFSLPDYVLESSNGFRINELPYLTNITITSVGPFRPIRCMYSFDGSAPSTEFDETLYPQDFALNFEFTPSFNFSSFSDGDYTMKLLCNNAFGIDGPLKEYSFVVAKDEDLVINWAKLVGSSGEQVLQEDGVNYVADSNARLELSLNRKNVSCEYRLEDSDSFIDIIISFFRRIFFLGWEDLSSTQRYLITSQDDIVFESEHDLSIRCIYDNKDAVKKYEVRYVDNPNPLDISLSSVDSLS